MEIEAGDKSVVLSIPKEEEQDDSHLPDLFQ